MFSARDSLRRLLREDGGQDVVEYALLAAIFAIAGIVVFPVMVTTMGEAISAWDEEVNDIWVPDAPL